MEHEDLIDVLLDLQHDLGKYIHLPLSFLPRNASSADVADAARRALFETRTGPSGVRSARKIWTDFEVAAAGELERFESFGALRTAVERALTWELAARAHDPLDRDALGADLAAVAPAVRMVIDEVKRDR